MRCASGSRPNKPVPPADDSSVAPLADEELDALFASLANASLMALAVSGGADSLALLDAVGRWRGLHRVVVLTVDHRLRRGSRAEANAVVAIARQRGLEARVLVWTGPRPASDIESAARSARYRLLLEASRGMGASHLVLAHHRDDLAETFLLRLARQAQKESLRQIIAMVGKHEMARPHPAAGFQEQSVAGGPGRAFDIGRRAWSGPYKYARLETALPRDGHDRICLSPRSAPQPMIDGQHNHAMQTPPTADGVEERQRVGAAGNSERHQAGVGERSKKRVEFFVGERRYGRIVSRRHWLVRP